MKPRTPTTLALLLALAPLVAPATAQEQPSSGPDDPAGSGAAAEPSFDDASSAVRTRLDEAVAELDLLRERIAAEKVPMSRRLSALESELADVRLEYQKTTRLLDSRTLDLSNLRSEIESRRDEATYLSNLLGEYIRNFESRLHVAELQRYEGALDAAKLALENTALEQGDVWARQIELLDVSLERLHDALGGTRFEGTAVDPEGIVQAGSYVMVGPVALFGTADARQVGTAEQRLGSLEPRMIPFGDDQDSLAASQIVLTGKGRLPVDPTLGNAHKIEATQETFLEHVRKGGPVMIPIFAMAAAALLVALTKWVVLALTRKPSRKQTAALLDAVGRGDEEGARELAAGMRGPVGRMLAAGVEHLREPRELIEEVMYETVLRTRLRLQRLLPFIAICAASAPLLGLLGTVTGIINTFKLITVFGSGDVKSLSGGISEALITTKFGLIVAIPSLLLHAFLSRKARGVVADMEAQAIAFVNRLSKTPFGRSDEPAWLDRPDDHGPAAPDRESVELQVREILSDMLIPAEKARQKEGAATAGEREPRPEGVRS